MISGIRIFSYVFTLALMASFGTCTAATSSVALSLSPQVISIGDTFTVDIFVTPDVAIAGMQFDLEFNETLVHVDNVTEGNLLTQSGQSTFFNSGHVDSGLLNDVYGTIMGASNVSTPAAFATITMVVDTQDTATTTLNLKNVIISDPDGRAVKVEVTDSNIEIVSIYDVDGDKTVNPTDYEIIYQHLSDTTEFPYPSWDVNVDGTVNIQDFTLVVSNLD